MLEVEKIKKESILSLKLLNNYYLLINAYLLFNWICFKILLRGGRRDWKNFFFLYFVKHVNNWPLFIFLSEFKYDLYLFKNPCIEFYS